MFPPSFFLRDGECLLGLHSNVNLGISKVFYLQYHLKNLGLHQNQNEFYIKQQEV